MIRNVLLGLGAASLLAGCVSTSGYHSRGGGYYGGGAYGSYSRYGYDDGYYGYPGYYGYGYDNYGYGYGYPYGYYPPTRVIVVPGQTQPQHPQQPSPYPPRTRKPGQYEPVLSGTVGTQVRAPRMDGERARIPLPTRTRPSASSMQMPSRIRSIPSAPTMRSAPMMRSAPAPAASGGRLVLPRPGKD